MESEDVGCLSALLSWLHASSVKQVPQKLYSNVHAIGDATTDCAVNAQVAPDNTQAIKGLNYVS